MRNLGKSFYMLLGDAEKHFGVTSEAGQKGSRFQGFKTLLNLISKHCHLELHNNRFLLF